MTDVKADWVKATKKEIIISSCLIAFAAALVFVAILIRVHGPGTFIASISRISLMVSMIFGFRGIVYLSPRGAGSWFNIQAIAGVIGLLLLFVALFFRT